MKKYYEPRQVVEIFHNTNPVATFSELLKAGYTDIRIEFKGDDIDNPRLSISSDRFQLDNKEYGSYILIDKNEYIIVRGGIFGLRFGISDYEVAE